MDREDREFYREQAMRLRRLGWDWEDVMVGHRRLERIQSRLEAWCDAGHGPITVEEWGEIVQACRNEETGGEGTADATPEDTGKDGGPEGESVQESGEDGEEKDSAGEVNLHEAIFGPDSDAQMQTEDPILDDEENDDPGIQERENYFETCLETAPKKVRQLLGRLGIKQLEVAMAWDLAWGLSHKIVEAPGRYGDDTRKALREWLRSLMIAGPEEPPPSLEPPPGNTGTDSPQTDETEDSVDGPQEKNQIPAEDSSDEGNGENDSDEDQDEDVFWKTPEREQARKGAPAAGSLRTVELPGGATMEMVWCPAGKFTRTRSSAEIRDWKKWKLRAVSEVKIPDGFWMAKYPVTQTQWKSVMGYNPSAFPGEDHPVESISWQACLAFCQKSGLRLPTEAEWEYACRAGSKGDFAGTGQLDEMGWYAFNSDQKSHPVGMKQPNRWGLYDMHGNVSEWCADQSPNDPNKETMDPEWPEASSTHLTRGGNWSRRDGDCASDKRIFLAGESGMNVLGFRPVSNQLLDTKPTTP